MATDVFLYSGESKLINGDGHLLKYHCYYAHSHTFTDVVVNYHIISSLDYTDYNGSHRSV